MRSTSRFIARAIGLLFLTGAALACGRDVTAPGSPARIVLPETWRVLEGFSSSLSPFVVLDSNARIIKAARVAFSSSNPSLLTVDPKGTVHSLGGLGIVRVSAELEGVSAYVDVTVVERLASVVVQPESLVLNRTFFADLEIHLTTSSGTPTGLNDIATLTSSNVGVARVDEFGRVTAGSTSGTALITLAVDTFVVGIPVRVTQFPASIVSDPPGVTVQPGGTRSLSITVRDSAGLVIASPDLTFTSNAPTLFTVNQAGRITGKSPGSGTVTAAYRDLSTEVGVLVGTAPGFALSHTTQVGNSLYQAAIGPGGQVVVSALDGGHVVRGTLPGFTLATTVATASNPLGVAINHGGTRAYVAAGNELSVIDLSNNTALPPIRVPGGGSKIAVVVSADDQRAYLGTAAYLYEIDLATSGVTDSIPLAGAYFLALHPTAPLLYVNLAAGSAIKEIDLTSMKVTRTLVLTVPGGTGFKEMGIAPDGRQLYVADESDRLVTFDLETGAVVQVLTLGDNGFGLAVSEHLIALATFTGVQVFDRASRVLLSRIDLGGLPRRPAISPDETMVVVPNQGGWVDFVGRN